MIWSLVALVLLVAWIFLFGRAASVLVGRAALPPLVTAAVTGLVALHLLLQALAISGLGWSRPVLWTALGSTLGATLGAALVAALLTRGVRGAATEPKTAPSLWDLFSAAAIGAFAVAAVTLRSTISDFVYHWGLKGKRYFEVAGLDVEFLARPENGYLHPDYPHLLPELFAANALLAGEFHPPTLLLWSVPFLVCIAWTTRSALVDRLGVSVGARAAAGITCAVAAFSIGYYQAGGADLPMAFAVVLGAVVLLRTKPEDAFVLGLCAALAASLKIEGVPFAFFLITLFALRNRKSLLGQPGRIVELVVPTLLVVVPWLVQLGRYELFESSNAGAIRLSALSGISSGVWWSITRQPWYGLPFLLLLLPALVVVRQTRWLGALLCLQLGFYFFLYVSTPLDPRTLVITSFPRLVLHLMPALLVGLMLLLKPRERARQQPAAPDPAKPGSRPGLVQNAP